MSKTENLLDVVNCRNSNDTVLENDAYRCPLIEGSQYDQHNAAKYFGLYQDKSVSHVAEVIAVVDVKYDGSANFRWGRGVKGVSDIDLLKNKAKEKLEIIGNYDSENPDQKGHKVFLLKDVAATSFKSDMNQMQRHNKEFDVSSLGATNAQELAAALDGKKWSELPTAK